MPEYLYVEPRAASNHGPDPFFFRFADGTGAGGVLIGAIVDAHARELEPNVQIDATKEVRKACRAVLADTSRPVLVPVSA